LPIDDTNLSIDFGGSDYVKVRYQDNITVSQTASNQYAVFLFKDQNASSDYEIHIRCRVKSSLAPLIRDVILQIYNRDSSAWETLDSNNTSGADTYFILTGDIITHVSKYYDANNWIACRLYQASL